MSELEQWLRAAMASAAEPAPAGLLEGIRRRHRRYRRRLAAGSAFLAVALAAAALPALHVFGGPGSGAGGTAAPVRPACPGSTAGAWSICAAYAGPTRPVLPPPVRTAPGTILRDCASANWGQLSANWRRQSFAVGPLWFVNGRRWGYVRLAAAPGRLPAYRLDHKIRVGVMIIEVRDGSRAVLRVSAGARSYFRFLPGFGNGSGPYTLRDGTAGLTLAGCPRGDVPGPNGPVTDFYLGFVERGGRPALAGVWPAGAARPIRVIFTCPQRGCAG
jgi:hypothetical protein